MVRSVRPLFSIASGDSSANHESVPLILPVQHVYHRHYSAETLQSLTIEQFADKLI